MTDPAVLCWARSEIRGETRPRSECELKSRGGAPMMVQFRGFMPGRACILTVQVRFLMMCPCQKVLRYVADLSGTVYVRWLEPLSLRAYFNLVVSPGSLARQLCTKRLIPYYLVGLSGDAAHTLSLGTHLVLGYAPCGGVI